VLTDNHLLILSDVSLVLHPHASLIRPADGDSLSRFTSSDQTKAERGHSQLNNQSRLLLDPPFDERSRESKIKYVLSHPLMRILPPSDHCFCAPSI